MQMSSCPFDFGGEAYRKVGGDDVSYAANDVNGPSRGVACPLLLEILEVLHQLMNFRGWVVRPGGRIVSVEFLPVR